MSENRSSDLIPPEIFNEWLQGTYLVGARHRAAAYEVLGWYLMLQGVYFYSVYVPLKPEEYDHTKDDDLAKTATELARNPAWGILHAGYCHMKLEDGQFNLRGIRIVTGPLGRPQPESGSPIRHSPIYWRSTQTKLEVGLRPKCSFIYRLAKPSEGEFDYANKALHDTADKALDLYRRADVDMAPIEGQPPAHANEAPALHQEPFGILNGTNEQVDVLNYVRSPAFLDHVQVFDGDNNTGKLSGLVVIGLRPPERSGTWELGGQYQQMNARGRWGQIYFSRIGGLAASRPKRLPS